MNQQDVGPNIQAPAWRLQLLAWLAAERAALLRPLRGIDEAMLSDLLVDEAWMAKDILAHIGAWDAFHTERMSLVLNGRINAIPELGGQVEMDVRNAELLAFSRNLSLEQALAVCLKERSSFLAVLARIPDELLHREIELPWGWRTHMREWTEWRCRHDAVHAEHLHAWRNQLPKEHKSQAGPIYLLRAMLKSTRNEFLAIANLVPAAERESRPVCGVWSLKDLVGHLTDWEQVGVVGLRQLAAGQTPQFDAPIDDFDTWNNAHAAVRRDQPWDEVWAEFYETRRELLALVDEMGEVGWQRPFPTPWDSQINGYFWTTIWTNHEHEHAADIRLALQSDD